MEGKMASEASPTPKEFERQTKATTNKKHGKELLLIMELLNRYIDGLNTLGSFTGNEDNDLEYVWLLLTTRSYNSLLCAFDTLHKGYYSQALMLIRSVFEDWLTAKDCKNNKETLDALLQGEDELGKGELRYGKMAERLSKEFPETWKTIYGQLSTIAHARNHALKILIDPDTKDLRLGSHYDDGLFLATYQVLLMVAVIVFEFLYKLLGDNATQWWMETLPTAQAVNAEIERIGHEVEKNVQNKDNPTAP